MFIKYHGMTGILGLMKFNLFGYGLIIDMFNNSLLNFDNSLFWYDLVTIMVSYPLCHNNSFLL